MLRTPPQPGCPLPPPVPDPYRPPRGEVTWFDDDPRAVASGGPSLRVTVDVAAPHARGREQLVTLRLRDVHGYLPSADPAWEDPEGHLAVSVVAQVPTGGVVEDVELLVPYVLLPSDAGGITEVEVVVYEPAGPLSALEHQQVELPEDLERSPDLLSVVTHTLVSLYTVYEPLDRAGVRLLRELLTERFQLDPLGEQALRRLLKAAARAEHTPSTLAEALRHVLAPEDRPRLVNLVHDALEAKGDSRTRVERFRDALLGEAGVHDHRRLGPEALLPAWAELELEPGQTLAVAHAAWRRLVKDYHPDRVAHLAPGFVAFAEAKTRGLNEAYARLREALEKPT